MYLLLPLLLIAPLVEIWLILQVGEVIGGGWTLLAIVSTAVIGLAIIRHQGLGVLLRARQRIDRDEAPLEEVLEGLLLAVAGLFLMIPGFITDTIGFALLTPLRHAFARRAVSRLEVRRTRFRAGRYEGEVYEGEFHREKSGPDTLKKF